jgi:ATP-dependent DNA ligase
VVRQALFKKLKPLEIPDCPFQPPGEEERTLGCRADGGEESGLPVGQAGAGGAEEFVEWTGEGHLRHSKFIALRDDKSARNVRRE